MPVPNRFFMSKKQIQQATPEDIKVFLEGHDSEKYIVAVELDQTGDWSVDESNRPVCRSIVASDKLLANIKYNTNIQTNTITSKIIKSIL